MRTRRFFPINGNTFLFCWRGRGFFYHRKELFFIGKIFFVHQNELYFSREKFLQQQRKDEEEGEVRKIDDSSNMIAQVHYWIVLAINKQ